MFGLIYLCLSRDISTCENILGYVLKIFSVYLDKLSIIAYETACSLYYMKDI